MSAFTGFDFSTAAVAGPDNVVTPAGVVVPIIDPGKLRVWGTRSTGDQNTLAARSLVLKRWVYPPGSTRSQILNYACYSLRDIGRDSALAIITKLANLGEALVGGSMSVVFDCRVDDFNVDPVLFRIYGRKEDPTGAAYADLPALSQEVATLPPDSQWANFSFDGVTAKDAVALFALCAYCVVKAPTQLNQTAFTASRPLAAAKGAGLTAFPAYLLPSVGDLTLVNNALQQDRRARIPFAHTLVSWATTRSVNSNQAGMASQASLWRDQGFGGLKLTRKLLLGYGAAVQRVARLRAQIPAFQEHWDAYHACASPVRAYYGAIYGPTNPIAARDDYSMLTLLSRDIDQQGFAAGRGMRNFGAGRTVPDDVKAAFVAACNELGLEIPAI
jgi:hypothetical protein